MYSASGLSNTSHTLKLVNNGTKNASSSGYYIEVDFYDYGGSGGGGGNFLSNPGFESGTFSSWNSTGASVVTGNANSGTYAAQVSGSSTGVWYYLTGLSPNTTYTLTAYGKLGSTSEAGYVYAKNYGGSQLNTNVTSTSYTQYTVTFTTGSTNTTAEIGFWKTGGSGNAYADDFNLH